MSTGGWSLFPLGRISVFRWDTPGRPDILYPARPDYVAVTYSCFYFSYLVLSPGIRPIYISSKNPGVGVRENIDIRAWRPDKLNNRLTPLRGKPQIQFRQNWPRIDGATAAYPIYASAFYALSVIPEDFHVWEYLENSRTPDAYNRIVKGDADIIFVAQPSGGQKKRAEESGVTLLYTPFAREAFVFIVNADNPVNSLTEQQVRDIFSGAITNWRTVGGNDQEIQTWQRPEDSGSQTVMQSQVMKKVRMISPQETEVASVMEGMIKVVAEYRNTNNAIGYTFRYYATQMNADKNIRLLAINGITPTAENIRNGKYAYIVDAFMVTRENTTSETQKTGRMVFNAAGAESGRRCGICAAVSNNGITLERKESAR